MMEDAGKGVERRKKLRVRKEPSAAGPCAPLGGESVAYASWPKGVAAVGRELGDYYFRSFMIPERKRQERRE